MRIGSPVVDGGVGSGMALERERMTWCDLGIGARELARMVADDAADTGHTLREPVVVREHAVHHA